MSLRGLVTSGREPLPPRRLPTYAYHTEPQVRMLALDMSARASVSLMWKLWLDGQYNELGKRLSNTGEILERKDEVRFACEFLASGGLDIYCLILCDPFNPLRFSPERTVRSMTALERGRRQRTLEHIIGIYAEVMLQLTDLVADQNDLGWVIYDRYPGVFYRLIEFLEDSSLWAAATGLLEHILACVGPVLEISKNPSLIRVLRRASPTALAAFCRFLALLILPGLAQGQNPILARRLHYPETVAVLRQVQRVVDSNVLWLIGEEGLVSTLISLCELRPNGLRVQQGGRSMMMFPPETTLIGGVGQRAVNATRAGGRTSVVPLGSEDVDWEDEEEEDGQWTDNEEQEGSGASGGSDGTADFIFDGSSLPTLFAGIERFLGIGQSQGQAPRAPAPSTNPTQLPPQQGQQPSPLPGSTDPSGAPPRRADESAALSEYLEYIRTTVRSGAVSAALGVNRATSGVAPSLPPPPPLSTPPEQGGIRVELGSGRGNMAAQVVAELERAGLPRDGAEQIAFLNRITSNQFQAEDPSRLVQWMLDRDMLEDDDMEQNFKSSMDIHWWVGSADTRQRWRLRDPSLIPERDDNRYALVCSTVRRTIAPGPRPPTLEEFNSANERLSAELFEPLPRVDALDLLDPVDTQRIVESQSEVLYLLNMFLSTFYFSDSWKALRDCRWVPRSVPMLEAAFGLDPSLPAFVDVPPHVNLSDKLRTLPRYLPPRAADDQEEPDRLADGSPRYPATWRLVPFLQLLGDLAVVYLRDPNQMSEEETENHQHGPDTMRKMELLRGLYEYWNAQDRREQEMVVGDAEVVASAWRNAEAIARVLHRDQEDSCVRVSLYQTLDSYLRTFLFREAYRDAPDCPQTRLGEALLTSVLERIYNGTRIPGLSGSMAPGRLLSNMLQVLGELLRYHAGNLRTLCAYVVGDRDMSHLNEAVSNPNRQNPVILSAEHEEVEAILKRPPLEREEHEPFGSVLLRRLFTFGVDTHHLLRSLLLSLTPGLRSTGNYISKPVSDSVDDVRLPPTLPGIGRTSDIISGDAVRISYVIRVSRQYTREISLAPAHGVRREELLRELVCVLARTPHRQAPEHRPFPGLMCGENDLALLRSQWPLPAVGPPPRLRATLFSRRGEGSAKARPLSTPCAEPLCSPTHDILDTAQAQTASTTDLHDAVETTEDAAQLEELAPLSRLLLGEPHKLIFSALCGLNIESMEDNSRLSVVTTVLLVFLRVASVGNSRESAAAAEANIRDVLAKMKSFAGHGHSVWLGEERAARAKERQARRRQALVSVSGDQGICACDWHDAPKAAEAEDQRQKPDEAAAALTDSFETPTGEGSAAAKGGLAPDELPRRCPSFMAYGSCDPPHEGSVYQREFGGCFYRSFFRLLCLWVGYYASCQRYVETVYFSTEVAFGEYKTMALFLMRILPDFFMPHFSQC
ncbi:conserved hypothetical protein [Leishmania mexicana MHOM/GT/2001/U1103]|uniref:Uncharacterized protein n=1 Tax=Leishmania mexicana (strain MHOM/GT/2001/U1103) TaxID=929439 RepID=E9B017_LEIMU|nr:conserved hypothetical protein [Leishmania mexicana MHOM/GT/2001/U1103]CBZ28568.1 conserved hypothetical protein [Leishmania mexicana MHOM/GT/2001/U1103]